MVEKFVGAGLSRFEDHRLVTGEAKFMADIPLPDCLEAAFIRSHFAAAEIKSIDTSEALKIEGVQAIFTASDLTNIEPALTRDFYNLTPEFVERHSVELRTYREPLLALDRVRRVGEPVALVIATDRSIAEDASELVDIEYQELPAVADILSALDPDAPLVNPEVPGNVDATFKVSVGTPIRNMPSHLRQLFRTFRIGRSVGCPIENRGVMAKWDPEDSRLTVWSSTQIPHLLRSYIAESLRSETEAIRVIVPDMGGSFGGGVYPEEVLIPFAARELGKPVRWLEDRTESLVNARHSRDLSIDATLLYDDAGTLHALDLDIRQDTGAYNPFGLTLPFNIASHARGPYSIENFGARGVCVLTNKTRNTPVRGAGRPEATFVIDRLIDMAARSLSIDPAEIRKRNLIPSDAMPSDQGMLYRDGAPLIYDSGDYPDQLRKALDLAGYEDFRERQVEFQALGRAVGIGISCHVEATGIGPHEDARMTVNESGKVLVYTGSCPHGQSHETTLAQIAADELSVSPEDVVVYSRDTDLVPLGVGTFGSRSAVTAGSVVQQASVSLRERLLSLASEFLECAESDLVLQGGKVSPKDAPHLGLSFGELAKKASSQSETPLSRPSGLALEVEERFSPSAVTFGSGTHIAIVEVDTDTGLVTVLEYFVVADCGTIINSLVVDGQQHGGIVHGLGNMLLEESDYDSFAQPMTTTFLDYLLPVALDVPPMTVLHSPHPTPLNPLGVKGAGEGATASAPAAIANAIVDAVSPTPIDLTEIPISPCRLIELLRPSI